MKQRSSTINNMDKRDTYKKLYEKLDLAIESEFYFESCLITYAIIEDRLNSIIKYANIKSEKWQVSEKIKVIRKAIIRNQKEVVTILDLKEIDRLQNWVEKRNSIVHKLAESIYSVDKYKNIALDGQKHAKYLCSCSTRVKAKKLSEIRLENMENYKLYKDIENNYYISSKERSLQVQELIKLNKEDEKYFDRRKARKLDENEMVTLRELKIAYDEVAITKL